jgi:hypothetical protein
MQPIPQNQLLVLVQGDDYLAIDSRSLVFQDSGIGWPSGLSNPKLSVIEVGVCPGIEPMVFSFDGVYTAPSESQKASVKFDLTTTHTTQLLPGNRRYKFSVKAEKNNSKITLCLGMVTVVAN